MSKIDISRNKKPIKEKKQKTEKKNSEDRKAKREKRKKKRERLSVFLGFGFKNNHACVWCGIYLANFF